MPGTRSRSRRASSSRTLSCDTVRSNSYLYRFTCT
uniref:Uncharacterized protein n=1 Tax=Arundo donax TaxID=35708 RepID=A0A0A9D2N7_ARUDO